MLRWYSFQTKKTHPKAITAKIHEAAIGAWNMRDELFTQMVQGM